MVIPEVDESEPLERWQVCWRNGLADALPTKGLEALRDALIADSLDLVQSLTVDPSPFFEPNDVPIGCCPISYCGWKAFGLNTTKDVYAFFRSAYYRLNGNGYEEGSRDFTHFVDATPRSEMRRKLLVEVNRTLRQREADGGELQACLAKRLRAGPVNEGVGSAA